MPKKIDFLEKTLKNSKIWSFYSDNPNCSAFFPTNPDRFYNFFSDFRLSKTQKREVKDAEKKPKKCRFHTAVEISIRTKNWGFRFWVFKDLPIP